MNLEQQLGTPYIAVHMIVLFVSILNVLLGVSLPTTGARSIGIPEFQVGNSVDHSTVLSVMLLPQ